MFNETRNDLLLKYSHATQQALVNARFLKSLSLSTLQAFCIYLVSSLHHVLVAVSIRVLVISYISTPNVLLFPDNALF